MDDMPLKRVEDIDRCALCGGRCCKRAPGHFVPEDLKRWGDLTTDVVIRLLETGVASVDCGLIGVMNTKVAPILTLAARGLNQPMLDFAHCSIRCVHLQDSGCAFPLEERPFECAVITPNSLECKLPGDIHMEFFWLEHQGILREVVEKISDRLWLEEVHCQIVNSKRTDLKIRGARRLIAERGLAETATETDYIAKMTKAIPF